MRKAVKRKKQVAGDQPRGNETRLTTPDLVILSLLAERPMHGYEVNATLEDLAQYEAQCRAMLAENGVDAGRSGVANSTLAQSEGP